MMTEMHGKMRFNSLDLLKFVLAIVIVFHHFQQMTGSSWDGINFFNGPIKFMYTVEFFFIISGFLCAHSIKKNNENELPAYMKNKALRIYPMVFIACAAYVAISLIYRIISGIWLDEARIPSVWRIFTSALLIFSGGAVKDVVIGINNPVWYLCVLMICYVIAWLINRVSLKVRIPSVCGYILMSLVGLGIIQYEIRLPFLNLSSARGYMAFFFGMVCYSIYCRFKGRKLFAISAAVMIVCLLLYCIDFDSFCQNQQCEFTYVLFPSILFVLLSLERFFKGKIWGLLGGTAFEMYLWHSVWLTCLVAINKLFGLDFEFTRMHMILFAVFMIGWGIIAYLFFEKPIDRTIRNTIKVNGEKTHDSV